MAVALFPIANNNYNNYEPTKKTNVVPFKKPCNKPRLKMPVQPIKNNEDIQRAKNYFLNRPERYIGLNLRDYTLFTFNINVGLRAGDLVYIRIQDVMANGKIVDWFIVNEQKNNSRRIITLRPEIKKLLYDYIMSLPHFEYNYFLFHPRGNPYKSMTVSNLQKKMKALQKELDFAYPLGTHSMRKTFAYKAYERNKDNPRGLVILRDAMGHKHESTTEKYIGKTDEEISSIYTDGELN